MSFDSLTGGPIFVLSEGTRFFHNDKTYVHEIMIYRLRRPGICIRAAALFTGHNSLTHTLRTLIKKADPKRESALLHSWDQNKKH